MKRILYIERTHKPLNGLLNKVKDKYRNLRFDGQDGFFEGSINNVFDVKQISLRKFLQLNKKYINNFDYLIANRKCIHFNEEHLPSFIKSLSQLKIPKILADLFDHPAKLPDEDFLEKFDIVFKRELFLNKDKYNISDTNKSKLFTTILSCPNSLFPATKLNFKKIKSKDYGCSSYPEDFKYDMFFSGQCTNQQRIDVLERLSKENFSSYFAIQQKQNITIDIPLNSFAGKTIPPDEYFDLVRKTKINLALSGLGPFTHRHIELWALASFFISTPEIRKMQFPFDLKEGIHYIAFDNLNDLVDKCKYYIENYEERKKIALAGRKVFEKEYSFEKHGQYIKNIIEKNANPNIS